ncbi:MAG: ABC transporter ATP-binding protein [Sphingobacterium sp.]|nr:ABC transporter ATP-binding protein [Sphingobacterium sp.]
MSLLGPNGAGKSTTISMLSGLLAPTEGDASIMGHSVTKEPEAAKASLGVVPQDIALYPDLSARENLDFWGKMYGLRGAALKQRVDEVLEIIGLADRQKDHVGKFSGGMKRRVNIGAALLHKPAGRSSWTNRPWASIRRRRRHILDNVKELNQRGHDRAVHHPLHGRSRGTLRSHRHHGQGQGDRVRHARRTDPDWSASRPAST